MERVRPEHPVFEMARANKLCLEDTCPLLHHGDEGRTYKRGAIMIISTHGVLDYGCSQAADGNKQKHPIHEDPMRLNFLGSTLTNHFIWTAMPSSLYKDSPESLDIMLGLYSQDMLKLGTEGVKMKVAGKDEHLHFICLAAKGDLPYFAKAGQMRRTFASCPKQSISKAPAKGICWMCLGGVEERHVEGRQVDWPWEDFSNDAKWFATRGLEPPLARTVVSVSSV